MTELVRIDGGGNYKVLTQREKSPLEGLERRTFVPSQGFIKDLVHLHKIQFSGNSTYQYWILDMANTTSLLTLPLKENVGFFGIAPRSEEEGIYLSTDLKTRGIRDESDHQAGIERVLYHYHAKERRKQMELV